MGEAGRERVRDEYLWEKKGTGSTRFTHPFSTTLQHPAIRYNNSGALAQSPYIDEVFG